MNLNSMGTVRYQIIHWLIPQGTFYWPEVTRNKFCAYNIIITSVSTSKLRKSYMVMFLTYSGMDQDQHTNKSKYGV